MFFIEIVAQIAAKDDCFVAGLMHAVDAYEW